MKPRIFEIRVYVTGWVVRVGRLVLRWDTNPYKTLSLERIGRGIEFVGGRVWPKSKERGWRPVK